MPDLRHPTDDDLLAWDLFMLMDAIPHDVIDPPLVKGLIDIHRGTPRSEIHQNLYDNYKEYRETFVQ